MDDREGSFFSCSIDERPCSGCRILGMRRPKKEAGGGLNRSAEHGVVFVLGVAGRSKEAKEGLAGLERFEGR